MKHRQKSIYSLLDLKESEFADETQRERNDWDRERDSPEGRMAEPTRGSAPE